jgi:hypothetical protein
MERLDGSAAFFRKKLAGSTTFFGNAIKIRKNCMDS